MSARAHVVVVHDDPVQLRRVTALLGAADHEVTGYLDVSDALTGLSARPDVDLFVVDLPMPGIDGWQLCRLLRSPEFERFNHTPILVISATLPGHDVASITRDLGADAFLEVPFEGSTLRSHVERLLLGDLPSERSSILEVRAREMRASEARYRTLFETIPDIVLVTDAGGRVAEVNPDGLRALKSESSEVLGRHLVEFADPPCVKVLSRWLGSVEIGGATSLETDLVDAEGKTFPVELTGRRIEHHGAPAVLVVGRDLTERRRSQEEQLRLERQMRHAQRLESLGVLAGGVAHDFNNLLVGILGNASLALMDLTDDSPLRDSVHQIELAARRAAELTQQILAFAGKGRTETQDMDISSLVREMGQLVEPAVSKKARVSYALPDSLPPVAGDPGQIRQVVMNLIINASDALGGKAGTIAVDASVEEVPPTGGPELVGGGRLEPGRYVVLRVRDDGCGMDGETLNRIFEPFFTTKFTGRGLGLAATLGIVRAHGGGISVRSEPRAGTTMTILLPPSVRALTGMCGEQGGIRPKWTGGGTVLVVDDEPSVRRLARAVLSRNRFVVAEARNGVEGVALALDPGIGVDVVVLDLTMPEMDGREALAAIRARRPDLPVLVSSGYPPEEVVLERGPGEPTEFLKKPYGPSELLEAVSALLRETTLGRGTERGPLAIVR